METVQDNTQIPLHNKYKQVIAHVQIDSTDYLDLCKYKWSPSHGYAYGQVDGKRVAMHRYIMGNNSELIVDHIDGNRLNNKRSNLRLVTAQVNAENKKVSKSKKSSQFRNVQMYARKTGKHVFAAILSINGIKYDLGLFKNAEDAAIARDIYVVHKKIDTVLNFPEKRDHFLKEKCPEVKNISYKNIYRGVYKNEKQNTYSAKISIKDIDVHILEHDDELLCAKAYDNYVVGNNIIGKRLNFPNEYPNYGQVIKTTYKEIDENYIGLVVIKAGNEIIVKINKSDYDKIKYYPLHINVYGYPSICNNSRSILLHRFIMDANDPKVYIDHINCDKLDCTRSNLRFSDSKMNAQNRLKLKNCACDYIGVSKNNTSWDVCMKKDGIKLFRWTNTNIEFVARARDLYIMEYLKNDYYKLNFTWTESEVNEWKVKINEAKAEKSQYIRKQK